MKCLVIHFLFGCWLVQRMQNKHRLSGGAHSALHCSSCSAQYCAGCCAQKSKSLRGERALKGEVQEERGLLCYLSRAQLRDLGVFSMQEMDPAQSVCSWSNETQVFLLPQISPFGYTCMGGAQNLLRQLVHEASRLQGSLCSPSGRQPQR